MGKQMNHLTYNEQLAVKTAKVNALFAHWLTKPIEVYPSPKTHYRMRAQFAIWHDGEQLSYVMFDKDEQGNKKRVFINQFSVANHAINALMPVLLEKIKQDKVLADKLFEVRFLSATTGDRVVVLLYHKVLDDVWHTKATTLAKVLGVSIIGRSRKQKWVIGNDFVNEAMSVDGKTFYYKQPEGAFSQPNAVICQQMLSWACQMAKALPKGRDLLELYCGNGNFTLPLSRYFNKVLATELAKSSVSALMDNIAMNGIHNIATARLSALEFATAWRKIRTFRRLEQAGIDLDGYDFGCVLVDPPRAGIDEETLGFLQEFDAIIYISCNIDTLYDNLQVLTKSHNVIQMALFDQFPDTHHIESGVFLRKK